MDFTLDSGNSLYQIRSYEPNRLVINEDIYTQSIIIMPNQLIYPWQPQVYADLTSELLRELLDYKPSIILLGTGSKSALPDYALLSTIYQAHVGIEVMETAAACRTFNVLATEGRYVLAALILS